MSTDTHTLIAGAYIGAVLVFFCGAWWGRVASDRRTLTELEDEACRALLHGNDLLGEQLLRIARRITGRDPLAK